MKNIAQGTIEYLVIMAVVFVIGLLVVSFVSTFFSSSSGVSAGVGSIGSVVGPISISETVVDFDGDGFSAFQNASGETLTVTKIVVGGVDNNYDRVVPSGSKELFKLSELSSGCVCSVPGESVNCVMTVYYVSSSGISKTETKTVVVDCVEDAVTDNPVVNPQETDAPIVELSSPEDENISVSDTVIFSYSVTDASNISSCSLIINSVVDQTDSSSPFDFFTKTFSTEAEYIWDVNCVDEHGNTGTAIDRNIIYNNPYLLSDCNELQNIELDLTGDYNLANDINCYDATHDGGYLWNSGAGFTPIGINSPYFTGSLDGKGYIIYNLYENRTSDFSGLFGISFGEIKNVGIVDVNIISTGSRSAGLVGYNGGDVNNVYITGNVSGATGVGLLAGANDYIVNNGYSDGNVTCSQQQCGGLVGTNYEDIFNSYSIATVTAQEYFGESSAGGLVGISQPSSSTPTITNSFATGEVTGTGGGVGGLVGAAHSTTIVNSHYYNFAGNPSVCVEIYSSSTIDCTTQTEISYFQGNVYPANAPFTNWNFFEDWEERFEDFPSLTWQNLGGDLS